MESPTSARKPNGPQKPSSPAPGYTAKCVPGPPTLEIALPTLPGVTAELLSVKFTNPTLPVTKNLNGPGVWNFGPNKPVSGRSRVVVNDVLPPLFVKFVKLRSKS